MKRQTTTQRRRWSDRGRSGLTVIEVILCMAILGMLLLFLLSGIAYGRGLGRDAACHGHLRRLWIASTRYANSHNGHLFVNEATPLRISNVIYKNHRSTGWGALYPRYLGNYKDFFCPADPGRGPAWRYGWSNWGAETAEVQCSYGYRGRQGFKSSAGTGLTMGMFEQNPGLAFGCDYYEPFFDPPRIHHKAHVNVLRATGRVEDVAAFVSFGPAEVDFYTSLNALDR